MKNRNVLLALAAILAFSALACGTTGITIRRIGGSGEVVEEERAVEGFSSVNLAGIGHLYVELGEREALTIEAEDNLIGYIETEVKGQQLVISIRDGVNIQPEEPIRYYLTVVNLDEVIVSGLGDVNLPELEADRFKVLVSGGGNIDLDGLTAGSFEVDITGLGDLNVDGGEVDRQEIRISGGGSYNASRMESAAAEVTISGLGSATLRVSDTLDVVISGGGDVDYYGSPAVSSSISGLGKLNQIGK